jgi:hypothetical protein
VKVSDYLLQLEIIKMGEQHEKRLRTSNWSQEEKDMLINCINKRLAVIENKTTDTNNNARKLRAWKEIHEEFTAMFNNKDRNITRLKEQWRRMKQMAKKNVSKVKTYRQKTGGGPPLETENAVTELDWAILDMIPHEFEKDENIFDSDNINPEESPSSQSNPVLIIVPPATTQSDSEIFTADAEVTELSPNNGETVVSEMPNTVTTKTRKKGKKRRQQFMNEMSSYEKEILKLQREKVMEEMQHTRELFKLQINNEKESHELKIQMQKELHEIEKEKKLLELKVINEKIKII